MKLPLEGIVVLEFCQYLAGPWAGLRLSDLGAQVIKIERPGTGEACRHLATKNIKVDGDSLVFHSVNRGKDSFAANLKDPADVETVKQLIARADVLTHNFRPGVMERLGFDYASAHALNPRLVYASVTGYGTEGPWRDKPGQDLLAQSLSGLMHLTGKADDPPTPFGLATADGICGLHMAQGILAALAQRDRTGRGSHVEVSLLESLLDLQFEALTTHLNDGHRPPNRSRFGPGHPYQGAPYGIYPTQDGHLALAMGRMTKLADTLGLPALNAYTDGPAAFVQADEIRNLLANHLAHNTTGHWLAVLESQDIWCAPVLNYAELREHPGYQAIGMEMVVERDGAPPVRTLRSPIQINGQRLINHAAAPRVGRDNAKVLAQLGDAPGSPAEPQITDDAKPLDGLLVVDLSQFLSGPSASLRLADLGATVIKVERPATGDICRHLYVSDVDLDGDSTIFHAINRNKLGYAADLKDPADLAKVRRLLKKADVVMHNFRPGVIDRLGLDYDTVKATNPNVVYGEITGYGHDGPWVNKPGQDLLLQALSGLTWLSGNADDGPVPMGLAVVDIWSGALLAQGLLAALVGRSRTGRGAKVEVNMLEAILDYQIEPWTVFFHDGELPQRTASNNAHALLGAPYGVYQTADGYLALAMGRIPQLGELLDCSALLPYENPDGWFHDRDAIKGILANHLKTKTTQAWLDVLEPADIWCAGVLDWAGLMQSEGFTVLDMIQTVQRGSGTTYQTPRCPIRFDGKPLKSPLGSCSLGEHNTEIEDAYTLNLR
ncbi:MAG: CaiB/BaiF CoA-transferase family protein [Planctomycetota bacterium]